MEVHRGVGPGFLEAVYHEALALEFAARKIPFGSEVRIPIKYKDHTLTSYFQADFICFGQVIVEIKALKELTEIEEAQILNYMRVARMSVGLLINFGAPSLQRKRFAMTHL